MRVAVCLSGYLRGFRVCLPTWHKYLFNQKDIQFDIFACLGPWLEYHVADDISSEIKLIKKELNVVNLVIKQSIQGPYPSVFEQQNYEKRSIEHFLSMFHKIKIANELKIQREREGNFKYNVVMRFRPDVYLKSPILIDNSQDYNQWFVPKHGDFCGLNDQVCWSSSENMNNYATLYDEVEQYLLEDKHRSLNHEIQLLHKWKQSGCGLQRPYVSYQLARSINDMLPDNEIRER